MGIHHSDQAMGTLGGTVIAFIGIVDGSDILKTGILACVGAMVSFGVSKGLHQLWPPEKPKDQGKVKTKVKIEFKKGFGCLHELGSGRWFGAFFSYFNIKLQKRMLLDNIIENKKLVKQ